MTNKTPSIFRATSATRNNNNQLNNIFWNHYHEKTKLLKTKTVDCFPAITTAFSYKTPTTSIIISLYKQHKHNNNNTMKRTMLKTKKLFGGHSASIDEPKKPPPTTKGRWGHSISISTASTPTSTPTTTAQPKSLSPPSARRKSSTIRLDEKRREISRSKYLIFFQNFWVLNFWLKCVDRCWLPLPNSFFPSLNWNSHLSFLFSFLYHTISLKVGP